jgi:hypothetical protein
MKKENLVLTISIGDYYNKISKLTLSSIQKYSKKINSDFLNINEETINHNYILDDDYSLQKFQIYDLLNQYKRIIYFDIDLIIREDTPNLFDIVPTTEIGLMNEAKFKQNHELINFAEAYGEPLKKWDGTFYNTGVMVISRIHKPIFKFPKNKNFISDDLFINMRVLNDKTKVFGLDWKYNRLSTMDSFIGKSRLDSYIVHYSGAPQDQLLPILSKDIEKWKEDGPEYSYPHNIGIQVSAGMGDQLCSEPAIRYTQKIYPNSNIYLITHHTRLFEHLDMPVFDYNKWEGINDSIKMMYTCPDDDKSENNLSHVMFHPTDFASISMIRRTIPNKDKTIKLKLYADEVGSVLDMIKDKPKDKPIILVHPGKWWASKTLPTEWWQEVIDKLSEKLCVCLIGKTIDEKQGYLPVICPKDGIDLRDLTSLGELISIISITRCVLTNDSSPLHIAGAFDNWIVTIPTAKHPDHILPFRNGTQYYKTKALYKKLLLDDLEIRHTEFYTDTIDLIPKGKTLYDYIPDVDYVVGEVLEIYLNEDVEAKKSKILL